MADLPFLASGGAFEAFLERVRISPRARIDITWLVECLGISQRPNAGQTFRWLQSAGVLDNDGFLTGLGQKLLTLPSDKAFREAALEGLETLVTPERLERLRSGDLSKADLRKELVSEDGVGVALANKAIVGFCILAEASGDAALVTALGKAQFKKHRPVPSPAASLQQARKDILSRFELFTGETGGIDSWLKETTPDDTIERLMAIPQKPLSAAQLNQLLTLTHAPPLSEGFFKYYWLAEQPHTYDLTNLPCYREDWHGSLAIFDIDQLYWGLYRFYVDALLYFGNIRSGYEVLRDKTYGELETFFAQYRSNPEVMISRGPALPLREIDREDRYLISEMACKSYAPTDAVGLEQALLEAYADHQKTSPGPVTLGHLLGKESGAYIKLHYQDSQKMFEFAADEILDQEIHSESELRAVLQPINRRFTCARESAVANTSLYLSSVGEMDVYVATSMRARQDFLSMSTFCDQTFNARQLRRYDLRYFDPTLSAATNHEDKGLIECLMVKCAKVLIYTAGEIESYGKDVEAAMALSLGKPVIFFCSSPERQKFYKDVHPLSRLVDFATGVAVGAMVTDSVADVIQLLDRLFRNSMHYVLERKGPGYHVLKEALTDSVVRLQTSDDLLRETFWNHYRATRQNTGHVDSS